MQLYVAVQLMKKGFAVGMLVDRLRKKTPVDESTVAQKLEQARNDVDDAGSIFREVRQLPQRASLSVSAQYSVIGSWFFVVLTPLVTSTKLSYVEPGKYWD